MANEAITADVSTFRGIRADTRRLSTTALFAGGRAMVGADMPALTHPDTEQMFFADVHQYRGEVLSDDEIRLLVSAARQGYKAARDRLLFANIGMIADSAGRYLNLGLSRLELIAEASLMFWREVHRYDPNSSASLATYMRYWVRHAQSDAVLTTGRRIFIPKDVQVKINRVQRARRKLVGMNTVVTPSAVAAETGLEVAATQELMTMADWERSTVSLDAPKRTDDEHPLSDYIRASDNPEREVLRRLTVQGIHRQIAALSYDQRLAVVLRHGILDGNPRSQAEVAQAMHVSRRTVRGLERAAYAHLRQHLAPNMLDF